MANKVKEHIGFHYLLGEIMLRTLILLKLKIFCKKYLAKSQINPSLTTYLEYNLMTLSLYRFHKICVAERYLLVYTYIFSPKDYNKNYKIK